jgi:tetratricopeptide (TPR) repeat protein
MKSINVLLIGITLCLQVVQANAQQLKTPALFDSLNDLITYFKEKTSDVTFREALKNAAALCNENASTDSLVNSLIRSEDLLIDMINDSAVIGRYFCKAQKLSAFGEATMQLAASVLPEKKSLLYARALYKLGILNKTPDYLKTSQLFEESLALRKKISGEEDSDYIKTLVNLALVYEAEGKKDTAYKMLLQSLATTAKTKGTENHLYADELFYLANFYYQNKRFDTAILLYDKELFLRKKILGDTNAGLALYLCRTALSCSFAGQYKKAFAFYEKATAITQQALGEENFQYAWCLSGIGGMHYSMGEYEEAIPYFDSSLEIEKKLCAEGCCTGDIPVNLHNLATTYQSLGRYEKALPLFQEPIAIEKSDQKNNYFLTFDMS